MSLLDFRMLRNTLYRKDQLIFPGKGATMILAAYMQFLGGYTKKRIAEYLEQPSLPWDIRNTIDLLHKRINKPANVC